MVNSTEQIISQITNGKTMAGLSFNSNFTDCFEERIQEGVHSSDQLLQCTQIGVYLDSSHYVNMWLMMISWINSFKQIITTYLPQLGANSRVFLPAFDILEAKFEKEIELKFEMETFFASGQVG